MCDNLPVLCARNVLPRVLLIHNYIRSLLFCVKFKRYPYSCGGRNGVSELDDDQIKTDMKYAYALYFIYCIRKKWSRRKLHQQRKTKASITNFQTYNTNSNTWIHNSSQTTTKELKRKKPERTNKTFCILFSSLDLRVFLFKETFSRYFLLCTVCFCFLFMCMQCMFSFFSSTSTSFPSSSAFL